MNVVEKQSIRETLKKPRVKDGIVYAFAILFALLNFVRIVMGNFWGDEAFSIRLAKMPVDELIVETAQDVHPPLYYLVLKFICTILGKHEYVYVLVSVLPVFIAILFAVVAIKKEFGRYAAILFIILSTVMRCCLTYNVEVRMYSWACLFVSLCFWYAYHILQNSARSSTWILFTVNGLAAAYTHYYALIAAAFIYLGLFVVLILRDFKNIKKCIICSLVTIAVYLPWLNILLDSFERTSEDWWATDIPGVIDSIKFIFDGKTGVIAAVVFLIAVISVMIKSVLNAKEQGIERNERCNVSLKTWKKLLEDSYFWMIITGVFTCFGMYLVGYILTVLIRPFFLERYLFMVTGIVWIILSTALVKAVRNRKLVVIFVIVLLMLGGIDYARAVRSEWRATSETRKTVEYIEENAAASDIVATDINHFDWTILDCYFEAYSRGNIGEIDLQSVESKTVWLFSEKELSDEEISSYERNGCYAEYIQSGHFATLYEYSLYKIYKK